MADVDEFGVAKKVAEQLKGLDRQWQQRILRWVSESLGLEGREARQASSAPEPAILNAPDLAQVASAPQASGRKDIKSFMEEKKPKSDNQFAAAVAFYYRFEAPDSERRESIDAETLQEATRLAGRKRLSNPTMTLVNAKNQGYLDKLGKGEFRINSVGENLVAMTLPGEGSARKPRASPGGKKGAPAKGAKKPQEKPTRVKGTKRRGQS